jgi:multicomponent Na+:H+ antiporter subunit B
MTAWLDIPLLIVALALAVLAIRIRRLVAAVVALGAYSFVLALEWALLGAVDVSFTEAVVGAGASTVLMLAALRHTGEQESDAVSGAMRLAGIAVLVALGGVMAHASAHMPRWADPNSPASVHVSPRYIEGSERETHTPNMVTAVVTDYRGYDTLLETTVICTAALAALLILSEAEPKR